MRPARRTLHRTTAIAIGMVMAAAWAVQATQPLSGKDGADPFFPLGLYYVPRARFQEVQGLGFNMVHLWALSDGSTGQGLDDAARLGLKVIIELSDVWRTGRPDVDGLVRHVRAHRDHGALHAWYLVDEPAGDARSVRAVGQAYRVIKSLDPKHPVLVVINTPSRIAAYAPSLDILGVDPYPVPNLPLGHVYQHVAAAAVFASPPRPVWAVLQAHVKPDSGPTPARYPTAAELRNMAYQALVGRAVGLVYFSFEWNGVALDVGDPALYRFLGPLNAEVRQLAPVLLSGSDLPLPGGPPAGGSARLRALTYGGRTYVLAVNPEPRPSTFRLALGSSGPDVMTTVFEGQTVRIDGGVLADDLPPYGVRVYLR